MGNPKKHRKQAEQHSVAEADAGRVAAKTEINKPLTRRPTSPAGSIRTPLYRASAETAQERLS